MIKYNEELHRKILEETLEDGGYQIDNTLFTGKGGKIEFEVAFIKELINQKVFSEEGFLPEYLTVE